LDEFRPDFDIPKHFVWEHAKKHDNLLFTPHIGGSTVDAWLITEEHNIKMIIEAFKEMKRTGGRNDS
jgi:D-3-phosphoglycerate dehydrogenase